MSIYKRGDIYWIRLERKGQVVQESTGKTVMREAKLYEARRRLETFPELEGGVEIPTLKDFTRELFPYWRRELKPNTRDYYFDSLRSVVESDIGDSKLNAITPRDVERYKSGRAEQVGVVTVNHSLRALRRALRLAVDVFDYKFTPTKIRINTAAEPKRDYVITEADFQRFLEDAGRRQETVAPTIEVREGAGRQTMQALLTVLYDCGLRAGEACGLTWDRVNLEERWLFVDAGKTKAARRKVPLTSRVTTALKGLKLTTREGVPFVFTRYGGRQAISPGWASHEFLRSRRRLGLPEGCVLHSLRHSTASRLGNKGCTQQDLLALMGWATPALAARYCHLDQNRMAQVIGFLEE